MLFRSRNAHIRIIMEKVDGSMITLWRYNDQFHMSTKGAFDTIQAIKAQEIFLTHPNTDTIPDDLTLIFEVVYPDNRIVIGYEKAELVLLAARNRLTGEYLDYYELVDLADRCKFRQPNVYNFGNIADIITFCGAIDTINLEGFVIEYSDGTRWKVKTDWYVDIHRVISKLSFKHIVDIVKDDRVNDVYKIVPDELLVEFEANVALCKMLVDEITRKALDVFNSVPKGATRKEQALIIMQTPDVSSLVFALLDGKDIRDAIYKRVVELGDKINT